MVFEEAVEAGPRPRLLVINGRPPVEPAAMVYERSRELARSHEEFDVGTIALDLLDAAGGSHSTLEHALRIGCQHVEQIPGDVQARVGVQLMEAALEFLGTRSAPNSVRRVARRLIATGSSLA